MLFQRWNTPKWKSKYLKSSALHCLKSFYLCWIQSLIRSPWKVHFYFSVLSNRFESGRLAVSSKFSESAAQRNHFTSYRYVTYYSQSLALGWLRSCSGSKLLMADVISWEMLCEMSLKSIFNRRVWLRNSVTALPASLVFYSLFQEQDQRLDWLSRLRTHSGKIETEHKSSLSWFCLSALGFGQA